MFKCAMWLGLLSAFAVSTIGCGPSGPKLYKISGTVKHNGKPIEGLYIIFIPDDQNTKAQSTGGTDKNGKFEMKINYDTAGVFPGPHTITAQDPLISVGSKTSTDPDYLAVIKKYGPGKSPMKMTIEKNESNLELNLD